MTGRLLSLLVVACVCSAGALAVSSARAGKGLVPAAHIPAIPAAGASGPRCPIPARYRRAFVDASRETRLPLALLTAVARVESEFRAEGVSSAGARGLLQVMPSTARELQADHPTENVLAGARYLRLQFDRFASADLALAAYNAGPAAVIRAGGAPGGETLTYVADVSAIWRSLSGCA